MPQENRPALVVVPGLRVEHVDARDWIRPRGASPLYPPLALIPDSDPQDMGDGLALDAVSYRFRWNDYLGRDGAA